MRNQPFPDRARVDAFDKVRGLTEYTADLQFRDLLYAMTVPAEIPKGTLEQLSVEDAMRVPGVVRVLTSDDFPPAPVVEEDGPPPPPPTLVTEIAYRGQPIALVLAETLEAAVAGADAVRARFSPAVFAGTMDAPGTKREASDEIKTGDAAAAFADATTVFEATYLSPTQHHNPIELLATTAVWAEGQLTIYESTQYSNGVRGNVARALGLDPSIVHVKCAYLGGGFGQKGAIQRQTALIAQAAILTGRPVKLVMPRGQIFHNATFRPMSRHRVRLGANANGKMIAALYDAEQQQSRTGTFPAADYHEATIRLYGIDNYMGTAADLRIDTQAPGYMRAPHPQASCFAFESAVDEMAYKLELDPLEFRLANDTRTDPKTGHPFSSRHLADCLREGARRFGWERRSPGARSMSLPDGTLVGWGVACGAYPSMTTPTVARLRIGADGRTRFQISGHEMGQGIRTAIAATLIEGLDIDPARLEIVIGDTSTVPQHITAGSWGTASVVPTAARAAQKLRSRIEELLAGRSIPGNLHRKLATVRRPSLEIEVTQLGPGQDASVLEGMPFGGYGVVGPEFPTFTCMSFIAHFVEVHVEPRTRRIRVPRVVSIADCGRVVSPRTAASQVRGGVVWAIGAALHEATEVDPRFGGYLNNDLADYVVPVNADIGDIDVGFIDQPDTLANSVGVKGLGEVAMVGASPAIANAIFHATGKRLRSLPIRVEHLLGA